MRTQVLASVSVFETQLRPLWLRCPGLQRQINTDGAAYGAGLCFSVWRLVSLGSRLDSVKAPWAGFFRASPAWQVVRLLPAHGPRAHAPWCVPVWPHLLLQGHKSDWLRPMLAASFNLATPWWPCVWIQLHLRLGVGEASCRF